jgi:hypothetical protein
LNQNFSAHVEHHHVEQAERAEAADRGRELLVVLDQSRRSAAKRSGVVGRRRLHPQRPAAGDDDLKGRTASGKGPKARPEPWVEVEITPAIVSLAS